MFNAIVAMNPDGLIGNEGTLPWNIKEDLKRFRSLTTDKTIVMGRKTYNSLRGHPLQYRRNVVLTSSPDDNSSFTFIKSKNDIYKLGKPEDIWIIGGAKTFKLFEEEISRWEVTLVHYSPQDLVNPIFLNIDFSSFFLSSLDIPLIQTASGIPIQYFSFRRYNGLI